MRVRFTTESPALCEHGRSSRHVLDPERSRLGECIPGSYVEIRMLDARDMDRDVIWALSQIRTGALQRVEVEGTQGGEK